MKLSLAPLIFLCCLACGNAPAPPQIGLQQTAYTSSKGLPTYQDLIQRFYESRKLTFVYGGQSNEQADRYRRLVDSLSGSVRGYLEVEIKSDQEVGPSDWQERALVLVGTHQSNQLLQKVLPQLPYKPLKDGLQFDGQRYESPATSLVLPFYPNPLNTDMAVSVLTASTDDYLLRFLEEKLRTGWNPFGFGRWGYEIYQDGSRMLLGRFHASEWTVDKVLHYDFFQNKPYSFQSKHFRFILQGDEKLKKAAKPFAEIVEKEAEEVLAFLGASKPLPTIPYHLYPSTEQKGMMHYNTQQAHLNFGKSEIHEVVNDIYRPLRTAASNQMLCRKVFGKTKTHALEEGLAVFLTPNWQKAGYAHWASRLYHSDNIPPLVELLDNDQYHRGSTIVHPCLAASFVASLIHHYGKEFFLEKYKDWKVQAGEITRLEKEWHQYLSKRSNTSTTTKSKKSLPLLKGFNFAHEGYSGYDGYGSQKSLESLQKIRSYRSNAIAIVPYSYMQNPTRPDFIGIRRRAFSETDEGVIHAAANARQLQMKVILKPHIWIGGGHWPGDVKMASEAEWQQWFVHYHRWIAHYALLAEIHQMDVLCIGTELVRTTLERPQDWKRIIRCIRSLYSGQLTYAANWGEEFEQNEIWRELDYIGLDCYYPLSKSDTATDAELKAGFQQSIQKIERIQKKYNKPILFTEIGFRSKKAPWKDPHAGSRRDGYNGEHQSRCYQIVFESLQDKSWCQGILWWKFPSYLDYDQRTNAGFSPCGKPAEEVVKEWFEKMAFRPK
ncbi:MAG: hypothetical protein AAF990_19785 [Bacteroidota bacterium]